MASEYNNECVYKTQKILRLSLLIRLVYITMRIRQVYIMHMAKNLFSIDTICLLASRLEDNHADLIYTHYSKFLLTKENFEKLELDHWGKT